MPLQFAYPAAIGDLVAAVLAFVAIFAVREIARAAPFLVWLFNIVGMATSFSRITLATSTGRRPFMARPTGYGVLGAGPLLVSHYVVFVVMLAGRRAQITKRSQRGRIDAVGQARGSATGAA